MRKGWSFCLGGEMLWRGEFDKAVAYATEKMNEAQSLPEQQYWQGVKDGLRKCFVIVEGDSATQTMQDIIDSSPRRIVKNPWVSDRPPCMDCYSKPRAPDSLWCEDCRRKRDGLFV